MSEERIQFLAEFRARVPVPVLRAHGWAAAVFGFHMRFTGIGVAQADEISKWRGGFARECSFLSRSQGVQGSHQIGNCRTSNDRFVVFEPAFSVQARSTDQNGRRAFLHGFTF